MALTLTQLQLIKAGIHAEATTDALEAVSILSTESVDLILLDSVMPTIDGEFLHLMQSLGLNHPVVFFTGFGFEELRAVADYVLGFLDKQQDRFTLPERLRGFAAAMKRKPKRTPSAFGIRLARLAQHLELLPDASICCRTRFSSEGRP